MIPAILCCIYVLYLYRTLNAPEAETPTAAAPPSEEASLEVLSEHLASLQARLSGLLETSAQGGKE